MPALIVDADGGTSKLDEPIAVRDWDHSTSTRVGWAPMLSAPAEVKALDPGKSMVQSNQRYDPPPGTVVRPLTELPQQWARPSVVIPQVCKPPALMASQRYDPLPGTVV